METNKIKENHIRVIRLKANGNGPTIEPKIIYIDNTLEDFQRMVGGYVEYVRLSDDGNVVLVCNEEGKFNASKLCRTLYTKSGKFLDFVMGDCFICGIDEDMERSLTDAELAEYFFLFNRHRVILTGRSI